MAFVLISTVDDESNLRGQVVDVKDAANFGGKERLTRLLRLEITGATAVQISGFLTKLYSWMQYTVVTQNAEGWRIQVELDESIEPYVDIKQMRDEIRLFMEDEHRGNWTSIFHSQDTTFPRTWMQFDVAKNQIYTTLQEMWVDFDRWWVDSSQELLEPWQQYYFPDSALDPILASAAIAESENEDANGDIPADFISGGDITKAQAQATVVDRLTE